MHRLVVLQLVDRGLGSVRQRVLRRRGLRDNRSLREDRHPGLEEAAKTITAVEVEVEKVMVADIKAVDLRLGSRAVEVAEAEVVEEEPRRGNNSSNHSKVMADTTTAVE